MEIEINPLAKALKILGDEKRFMIIRLLLEHDLCVEALAGRLDISKSAVSQHLKILRDAGLVRGEKRGYFTHYAVEREHLRNIAAQLDELASIRKLKCKPGFECCGPAGKRSEPCRRSIVSSRNFSRMVIRRNAVANRCASATKNPGKAPSALR